MNVRLEPWSVDDMPLMVRLNWPDMTEHLGGPETDEQLTVRLERYVRAQADDARMFKVTVDGAAAGSVRIWEREWNGATVLETGWSVVPEFQGKGIASSAMRLVIEIARSSGRHPEMHAFPSVDNAASNAICRKLGFELQGEHEFEYPKGHWMTCNDWRLSLPQYT